jgi:hypothetical protein
MEHHLSNSALIAGRQHLLRAYVKGAWRGFRELVDNRELRRLVDLKVYRTWRMIRNGRSVSFGLIEPRLTPIGVTNELVRPRA